MFFLSLSFVDDLKVHSKVIKMTFNNTQDAGMILGMVLGHKCRIDFDYIITLVVSISTTDHITLLIILLLKGSL